MRDSVLVPDPGKPLTQAHLLFYNTDFGGHLFAIQSCPSKLLIVVDLVSCVPLAGYHYQIAVGDILGYSVLAAFDFVTSRCTDASPFSHQGNGYEVLLFMNHLLADGFVSTIRRRSSFASPNSPAGEFQGFWDRCSLRVRSRSPVQARWYLCGGHYPCTPMLFVIASQLSGTACRVITRPSTSD